MHGGFCLLFRIRFKLVYLTYKILTSSYLSSTTKSLLTSVPTASGHWESSLAKMQNCHGFLVHSMLLPQRMEPNMFLHDGLFPFLQEYLKIHYLSLAFENLEPYCSSLGNWLTAPQIRFMCDFVHGILFRNNDACKLWTYPFFNHLNYNFCIQPPALA